MEIVTFLYIDIRKITECDDSGDFPGPSRSNEEGHSGVDEDMKFPDHPDEVVIKQHYVSDAAIVFTAHLLMGIQPRSTPQPPSISLMNPDARRAEPIAPIYWACVRNHDFCLEEFLHCTHKSLDQGGPSTMITGSFMSTFLELLFEYLFSNAAGQAAAATSSGNSLPQGH